MSGRRLLAFLLLWTLSSSVSATATSIGDHDLRLTDQDYFQSDLKHPGHDPHTKAMIDAAIADGDAIKLNAILDELQKLLDVYEEAVKKLAKMVETTAQAKSLPPATVKNAVRRVSKVGKSGKVGKSSKNNERKFGKNAEKCVKNSQKPGKTMVDYENEAKLKRLYEEFTLEKNLTTIQYRLATNRQLLIEHRNWSETAEFRSTRTNRRSLGT